jgi:flagellar biosynthesis protein FliR
MRTGPICGTRRKLPKSMHHHPQTRPIILSIQAILFRVIACVWFVAFIAPRHVAFATRISAALIFTHALTVMTSIAAAVSTTTKLTVTGPIPKLLPN